MSNQKVVAVIGGGISGLSAVHFLKNHCFIEKKNFDSLKIVLFESSQRLGGWISSKTTKCGSLFQTGPRHIRVDKKTGGYVLKMLEDLGLEEEILVPFSKNQKDSKTVSNFGYIYVNGKFYEQKIGLKNILFAKEPLDNSVLSIWFKERFITPGRSYVSAEEENVHEFFQRRFNKQVADIFASARCRGSFGCEAEELGVNSVFPELVEKEKYYGCVSKYAFGIDQNIDIHPQLNSSLINLARNKRWVTWSLKSPFEILPISLEKSFVEYKAINLFIEIIKNSSVSSIDFGFKSSTIEFMDNSMNKNKLKADYIISAVPSYSLSSILPNKLTSIKNLLNCIKFTDLVLLQLTFNDDITNPLTRLKGFGLLIPKEENMPFLGIIYDKSTDFPVVSITIFLNEKQLPDDLRQQENPNIGNKLSLYLMPFIKKLYGNVPDPIENFYEFCTKSVPIYSIGHMDRLNKIRSIIKQKEDSESWPYPLALCGSSYDGISVSQSIASGFNAAMDALAYVDII